MKAKWLACLVLLALLAACSEPSQEVDGEGEANQEPNALAYVNGSPITVDEFEASRSRFNAPAFMLDAGFDDTLLQSLISSRAMALLAQGEMDAGSADALELKVAAYREELLVKEYLKRHATPEPVTQSMVQKYYDENPDKFSGGKKVEFEYFTSSGGDLNETSRKRILDFIANTKKKDKWEGQLNAEEGLPLFYRKARARVSVLNDPLKTLVKLTPKGEVSSVHIGEEIVVVRVLGVEQLQARPLGEVSGEIRKRLAPMQLRKSVKQLSKVALQQVKVEYPNNNN